MKNEKLQFKIKNEKFISSLFLLIVFFTSLLSRLYLLTARAIWHDEAFGYFLIKNTWPEMFRKAALDVHPPLYYIILKIWHYFTGDSLFALRFLSLIFGVFTVVFVYLFLQELFKNKILSLFGGLLVAISPFQIEYSHEARMYTLGTFLIIFSSWYLWRILSKEKKITSWILYGILVAFQAYTHYYLFFSIAAQFCFIFLFLVRKKRAKELIYPFIALLISILLYLPWLKAFLSQFKQVQEAFWVPKMTIWSVPASFWRILVGGTTDLSHVGQVILFLFVIFISLFLLFRKKNNLANYFVVLSFWIPLFLSILLSLRTSLFLERYLVFAGIFYLLIFILFSLSFSRKITLAISFMLLALCLYYFFANYQTLRIKEKPGMKQAVILVNENAKDEDYIIVGSSFVYFTFGYYNKTPIHPLLYVSGELVHFSGTALLSADDLLRSWDELKKESIVWMINTTGFGGYMPETPFFWQKLEEQKTPDLYGYQGEIIVTKYYIPRI